MQKLHYVITAVDCMLRMLAYGGITLCALYRVGCFWIFLIGAFVGGMVWGFIVMFREGFLSAIERFRGAQPWGRGARYIKVAARFRIFTLLLLLPATALAQREQQSRVLAINGQAGEANVIEVGGRAYVDVEGLTQLTHGSLSFNANRIILHLPTSIVSAPAAEPLAERSDSAVDTSELSRNFMRAGIEEIATIREWASTLAYAIQNGYPVTENWAVNSREQAAHDLNLAAAAASADGDRHALQLVTKQFEAVREWANKLVQERKSMDTAKYALSATELRDDPTSKKIIACGHFLAAMLGSGSFKDDPSCH